MTNMLIGLNLLPFTFHLLLSKVISDLERSNNIPHDQYTDSFYFSRFTFFEFIIIVFRQSFMVYLPPPERHLPPGEPPSRHLSPAKPPGIHFAREAAGPP